MLGFVMRYSWSSLAFLPRRMTLVLVFSTLFWMGILLPTAAVLILHEQFRSVMAIAVYHGEGVESYPATANEILQVNGEAVKLYVQSHDLIDLFESTTVDGSFLSKTVMIAGFHKQLSNSKTHHLFWAHVKGQPLPDYETIHRLSMAPVSDNKVDLERTDLLSMFRRLLLVLTLADDKKLILTHSDFGPMKGVQIFINPRAVKLILMRRLRKLYTVLTINTLGAGLFLIYFMRQAVKGTMFSVSGDIKILGEQSAIFETSQSKVDNRTMHAIQEELTTKFERQSCLAGLGINVSYLAHDIRNILANLQLNADRLSTKRDGIENAIGNNLSKSIEQCVSLLNWAVLYASEQERSIEKEDVLLKPILQEAIEFSRTQSDKQITCILDCDERFMVETNRILLFRAIYNLLHNSIKEMRGQASFAQLRILVVQVGEEYEIYVSDTGGGFAIEGEQSPRNLNVQRLQKGGSGLGLKIARDLIGWLGGQIQLMSSNAAGTSFLIILPRNATKPSLISEAKN